MPTCSIRTGRALLVSALLLSGCGADDKFEPVGPELERPSTSATTGVPVLVP